MDNTHSHTLAHMNNTRPLHLIYCDQYNVARDKDEQGGNASRLQAAGSKLHRQRHQHRLGFSLAACKLKIMAMRNKISPRQDASFPIPNSSACSMLYV